VDTFASHQQLCCVVLQVSCSLTRKTISTKTFAKVFCMSTTTCNCLQCAISCTRAPPPELTAPRPHTAPGTPPQIICTPRLPRPPSLAAHQRIHMFPSLHETGEDRAHLNELTTTAPMRHRAIHAVSHLTQSTYHAGAGASLVATPPPRPPTGHLQELA